MVPGLLRSGVLYEDSTKKLPAARVQSHECVLQITGCLCGEEFCFKGLKAV